MRSVKDKGKEELLDFKNRLARSWGKGWISEEDFQKLNPLVKELLDTVEEIEEEDKDEG